MSRVRRLTLTGLALAAAVVLVAIVSPRVGGIEGTGTQVAAQTGTEVVKDVVPLRCEAKAALEHDEDAQLDTLAALKRCRAERERTGSVLAEVYERVDARDGVRR